MCDAGRLHGRDHSRVVHLYALDRMNDDKPPPQRVGSGVLRQNGEQPLDDTEPPVSLGHPKAESTTGRVRSHADVSELGRVLRRRIHLVCSPAKNPHGLPDGLVLGVCALQEPKQDTSVGENEHQS
jgi:hypothetical protein